MSLRSTALHIKCGTRKCIFCVKQWGPFLLAFDWSFPTVHYLQHSSLACDQRSLKGEGCQDKIPDFSYNTYETWPSFQSLPTQPGNSLQLSQSCSTLFRIETASSTWKSGQQSMEGISQSVSRETAPDLLERSLATPEQSHFLLQFHDPRIHYNLWHPPYLPKCSWVCYVIWINQCKQTTSSASFFSSGSGLYWGLNSSLTFARQTPYHMSHSTSTPYFFVLLFPSPFESKAQLLNQRNVCIPYFLKTIYCNIETKVMSCVRHDFTTKQWETVWGYTTLWWYSPHKLHKQA
jgi:hypothetical protein